jgi:hemerythrin superfamily protein
VETSRQLIEQEHRRVEALFESFKESGDSELVSVICAELDAHAAAEEETFYTVVRDEAPQRREPRRRRGGEHGEARHLIGRIRRTFDREHVREPMNELEQIV